MSSPSKPDFLSKFLCVAKERLARIEEMLKLAGTSDNRALALEFHLLWGEAAMLDLPEIAQLAREAEAVFRNNPGSIAPRVACAPALRGIHEKLRLVTEPASGEAPAFTVGSGGCRVLVVDDSPFAARALSNMFEHHGFEVRSASKGSEALEIFESFGPRILVADAHVSDLDVSELCHQFRQSAKGRRTAVVLVSARARDQVMDCYRASGADDFVSKLEGTGAVVERVSALSQKLQG